MIMVAKNN